MTDRQRHINNLTDRWWGHINELFDDQVEIYNSDEGFRANLKKLTDEQIAVLDNPDLDMSSQISHDVAGIANRERHFLPRIRALHDVTPYLT